MKLDHNSCLEISIEINFSESNFPSFVFEAMLESCIFYTGILVQTKVSKSSSGIIDNCFLVYAT